VETVEAFEQLSGKFQPEMGRAHSAQFAPEVFEQRYLAFVEQCYQEFHGLDFTGPGS
jgi:hypothetical protein